MKSVVGHFLRLIVLLVLVAAGTFVLLSFSPVDPIRAYIGNDLLHVPPEQYARIAARWGLDQPLWERFGHWFVRVLQGDLGYSMLFNAPVASVIKERFSTSFALLGGAWLLSGILGTAMGFVAGRYLNRWPDKAICRLSYLLSSLPTFWIGMLLLALFAVRWPVFPVCCAWEPGNSSDMATLTERLRHLVLPVCALSLLGLGQITLHTRESIASVMKSDFVRFARSQEIKAGHCYAIRFCVMQLRLRCVCSLPHWENCWEVHYWPKKSLLIQVWGRPLLMPGYAAICRY